MKPRSLSLLMTVTLATAGGTQAQKEEPVVATASAEPSELTIGDPLRYTIEVTAQSGYEPQMPGLDIQLQPFVVRDCEAKPAPANAEPRIYTIEYELAVYDVGDHTIPAVEVPYRGPRGQRASVETEPIEVHVASVAPADAQEIRDVRPPRELAATTLRPILMGLAALAALLALAAGIAYLRRRPREEVAPEPAPPPRPPEEIAYEKLAELERSDLLIRGDVSEYYDRLSDIVREYIEGRYQVRALEMTSEETLAGMRAAGVTAQHVARFERVFPQWDLAKFAKHEPPDEVCRRAVGEARAIIDATKPLRDAAPEAGAVTERPRVGRIRPHDRRSRSGRAQAPRRRSRGAAPSRPEEEP